MASKRIITVFGATGVSGGSVAKYLLEDGEFAVRAVTRNANSDKAKALKAAGAEVVEADLGKPETLPATVEGAYGVSALTDFWAVFGSVGGDAAAAQREETRQGRSLVDAAKAAGVKHFVWFNLWDSEVPHFASKHDVQQYLESSGLPFTNFLNAFYYENIINPAFGMLNRDESGVLRLNIPQPADTVVPSYSAEQSGGWVLAAFKNPGKYLSSKIIAIGDNITPRRYAEVLSKALGEPVTPLEITYEQVVANTKSENPFVKELGLNMKYFVDFCQPPNSSYVDPAESKAVYPGQQDFATFVAENEGFKRFAAGLKKA